jgi:alanine-glyoxylate transaminase/serine-glyoxylate transaminase/serine-pyruvate transaminase
MVLAMRIYTDRYIITPGPTEIPYKVRLAMARETTNPDLDPDFLSFYNRVRGKIKDLISVQRSDVYLMVGEALMGLEIAIANMVRKGDRVVVIANGVYGEGFADIVRAYSGEPILVASSDWRRSVNLGELERSLEKNGEADLITLVHCDTPSALLNDLRGVAKVARDRGTYLVVDAVSCVGGVEVKFDDWGIDVLIAGSQKALNAPTGVTIMAISKRAWDRIERTGYRGIYLSLKLWREMLDGKGVFPYTISDPLIYALDEALNILFEEGLENVFRRHELARRASWEAAFSLGLEPFSISIDDTSPTVTALLVPKGVEEARLRMHIWNRYGVMLAGSWGRLEGKVIRIGHMGVQASRGHLVQAYIALARGLRDMGFNVSISKAVEAIESVFK